MNHIKNLLDGFLSIGRAADRRIYPAIKGFSDDANNLRADGKSVAQGVARFTQEANREAGIGTANATQGAKRNRSKLARNAA